MPEVDVSFQVIAPALTLVVAAVIVLVLDLILPSHMVRRPVAWVSALGVILAGWYAYMLWPQVVPAGAAPEWNVTVADVSTGWTAFLSSISADGLGLAFGGMILVAALAAVAMSVRRREEDVSGYYSLLLLAAAGMVLLAAGTSLLTIFVALELLSLALYVLVGFRQNDPRGKEGALKYLILGSVASGLLLYGFALLYGAVGSVWLSEFQAYWYAHGVEGITPLYKAGLALTVVGFAFKMALVPFHAWAPDAYQGAPASVSAFMAVGTKAAALAALIRILAVGLPAGQLGTVVWPLTVLAALSMFVGSILATAQDNMKRLLAYSSIAHAGYLFMALPGLSEQGMAAAAFYTLAYLFMTVGAFAIIVWLGDAPEGGSEMARYESLFYRRPFLAGALTLFLLALAGTPATAGFVGKVLLVRNALEFGGWVLIVSLVITTGISAYAYLRVVLAMIKRPAAVGAGAEAGWQQVAATADVDFAAVEGEGSELGVCWPLAAVVVVAAAATLYLGLFPQSAIAALSTLLPV